MRLDMHSKWEILKANVEKYQRTSKKGHTELLDRSYLATALGKAAAGDRTRRSSARKERSV